MPPLKFQNPEGKIITIDSPDGSIPTEQELDELFALAEKQGAMTKGPKAKAKPTPRRDIINELAGTSPEQLAKEGHWVLSGIQQTGKDILAIPAHFLNQLALNAPRSIAHTKGFEYPEATQSPLAGLAARAAGVVGGFKNPLVKLGAGAMRGPMTLSNLAKMAGAGAAQGFAYSPSENFGDIGQRAGQAAFSAAVPVAGAGISKALSTIPNRNFIAGRIINSLIKPTRGQFGYGKNPGLAVAQEKLIGNNLDELAENIAQRREVIGKQIGGVIEKAEGMVNMKGVLRPLDEALAIARKAPETNKNLIARLEGLRSDLRGIIGGKDLELSTPILANEMKQQIGALTKFTGNPSDDKLVNIALKQTYGRLRSRIEKIAPQVKQLNERWGNLMTAEIAAKNRYDILQRQNLVGFTSTAAGLGTALTYALLSGGKTIPSALAGLGAAELVNLTKSPKVMTRLASWLATSTPEAQRTLFQKLPQLKEAILGGQIALPSRFIDKLRTESES